MQAVAVHPQLLCERQPGAFGFAIAHLAGAASAGQGKGDDDYVHREEILKQQDENRQEVPGR